MVLHLFTTIDLIRRGAFPMRQRRSSIVTAKDQELWHLVHSTWIFVPVTGEFFNQEEKLHVN